MIILVYFLLSLAALPLWDLLNVPVFGCGWWWVSALAVLGTFVSLILIHIILLVVLIMAINPKSPAERFSKFYRGLASVSLPMLFTLCGVHIHTKGKEKLPKNVRFMLVCNHTHDIDPAVLLCEFPKAELGFVAKKEIYTMKKFRLVARIMNKLHCVPIDRENNRNAVEAIVKSVRLIKDDTVSVGVFPEGYTSLDGRLHEFRNGVFKIACKAGCPIVVCTLVGVRGTVKHLFKRINHIYLDVVDVISAEQVAEMGTSEISEHVHACMERSLENHGATRQEF